MEARGIRRKVDDLGRVVVPSSIRKALRIAEGDEVVFGVEDGRVVMSRIEEACVFCAHTDGLTAYAGKQVCWSCLAALHALARDQNPHPF